MIYYDTTESLTCTEKLVVWSLVYLV